MDLICYLHPAWKPLIRPAPTERDWMTATPHAFAYRCLPLSIANSHGWEVLSPCGFEAMWNGDAGLDAVTIRLIDGDDPFSRPVSVFGHGVLTFHIAGLFRTPPDVNLWVGGSPNLIKDGIQALTGLVETDWSDATFTMNWKFTRPNQWVRFERLSPICFFFPIPRAYLDQVAPRYVSFEDAPETAAAFQAWSDSRSAFQEKIKLAPPPQTSDHWQKTYYRGVGADGSAAPADHQIKTRLKPFSG